MTRLSFSRLNRYERCPLSYRLHYIDRTPSQPGVPLRFGSAVHQVLEHLVREHMLAEQDGPLSVERAADLWQTAWADFELTGLDVFREGLSLIQRFIREQGVLEHHDVLGVERDFELHIGPFEVIGMIDRVDRIDDETIEVIDYKTNRQLFTRQETDSSLQLSLYQLAAQKLWPWAKKVRLSYWMLRHGLRQTTERSTEDLQSTRQYVETLGTAIDKANEFPARLNQYCGYCEFRDQCPAYEKALEGQPSFVCTDKSDLEAVAKEREEVAQLVKLLSSRKSELERVLRAALKDVDELVFNGVRYAQFKSKHSVECTWSRALGAAMTRYRE